VTSSPPPIPDAGLQDVDRCVMCGLCLAHCPTYGLTRDEAESPRGRLALMGGLADGRLEPGTRLIAHLDSCLGCRACEAACPSGVPYGRLLDTARAQIAPRRGIGTRLLARAGLALAARPRAARAAGALVRWFSRSRWRRMLHASGLLPRLRLDGADRLLAWDQQRLPALRTWYPATGPERGRVALFVGCVTGALDRRTLHDALAVLHSLGIGVRVPADQSCCGALHLHTGEARQARTLAQANVSAFDVLEGEPVLFVASGCGAQLADYGALLGGTVAAERFSDRATELCAYLEARLAEADALRPSTRAGAAPARDGSCAVAEAVAGVPPVMKPLNLRVAVHEPCTLRNVLRGARAPYRLLERIPGIEIVPLPGNDRCCGAGGSHALTHPAAANALLADKLDHLRRLRPDVLATTNVGCALHLAAGARETGLEVEVLHPVSLLARARGPAA
jgi:glycolate oxidase iron-sulfur subunit